MAFFFDSNEPDTNATANAAVAYQVPKKDYQYFQERLHQEVLRSQRKERPLTVMRVTLAMAHEMAPLAELATLVKSSIREYDVLCALAPSDFAIVFPETADQYAETIAARIKGNVSQQSLIQRFELQTDIGIACFPHDGTNAGDLLDSVEQDLMTQLKRRHH